ncbi:MAG: serine protease [Planctomycetaceae bacterium]|nr:serine protease [Planctomycetaceae bacterium]
MTQNPGIASDFLFAQNFGSARGPSSRSTASPVVVPQADTPQIAQPQPKVASQWNQTNENSRNSSIAPPASTPAWNPANDPHPSVVRIIAFDKGGRTHVFGSGTYISSYGLYGIIITNWHVVRDSEGLVQVHFPDGFRSYSAIISHDPTWDLAILMISRPDNVPTIPIAKTAPKIGDPLWIAGYGSGSYRLIGGHCTQYVTPEIGLRNEFVELSVEARQGDSGGPIFNQKGELAGVLFGSGNRNTAGSFCGRVQFFLDQSKERIKSVPPDPINLFASVEPRAPRHTLEEGAELFRSQMVQSTLSKQPSSDTPPQYTYSDPRNGRGGAYTREVKPVDTSSQTSYPSFPNFPKQVPRQKNVGQNGREVSGDVRNNPTPGTAKTPLTSPNFSLPNERIAMSVPPGSSSLFTENAGSGTDNVLVSDSALVASNQPGNFFTTLKIIAAIVVVFFVVFHLVKLMSIIEEN